MSKTDKGKPHPSAKHALDEVLQNLQDLVRNELADDPPAATGEKRDPRSPATPRKPTPPPHPEQGIPTLTERVMATPSIKTKAKHAVTAAGLQEELALDLDAPVARTPAAPPAPAADDIPVLHHVVVPPPNDSPSEAQRVAAALAARFDALLRESGKRALDPAMIARLEQLVREALDAWEKRYSAAR
jgi:hypothetical protein